MKRLLLLILLASSGCAPRDERITVEFWTLQLSPVFNSYINGVIQSFEQQHPSVRIRWVDVPYDAALQKLLASAVAGNAPDVVNLSVDYLAKFDGMNAFADLRDSAAACGYSFLPNARALCTYRGRLVALPWYLNTYILIYNRELLARAGYTDADVPRTYDDLLRFAREYKDRTGSMALFWNIGKDSFLPMMLGSEGVEMTDTGLTRAEFNSPRGVELIDRWVQLYRDGYLPRESIMKTGGALVEAYQSGQAAMILTGPVFLNRIRTNAPRLYANTGAAPAVVGRTGAHELAAMSLSVLATGKHKGEAAAFALWVTNPANQLAFCRQATIYPSVPEALRDSFFTRRDGTLDSEARSLGAAQLGSAGRLRRHLLHQECDRLRDIFDEAIQQACMGTRSTRDALDRAAAEWNEVLAGRR